MERRRPHLVSNLRLGEDERRLVQLETSLEEAREEAVRVSRALDG